MEPAPTDTQQAESEPSAPSAPPPPPPSNNISSSSSSQGSRDAFISSSSSSVEPVVTITEAAVFTESESSTSTEPALLQTFEHSGDTTISPNSSDNFEAEDAKSVNAVRTVGEGTHKVKITCEEHIVDSKDESHIKEHQVPLDESKFEFESGPHLTKEERSSSYEDLYTSNLAQDDSAFEPQINYALDITGTEYDHSLDINIVPEVRSPSMDRSIIESIIEEGDEDAPQLDDDDDDVLDGRIPEDVTGATFDRDLEVDTIPEVMTPRSEHRLSADLSDSTPIDVTFESGLDQISQDGADDYPSERDTLERSQSCDQEVSEKEVVVEKRPRHHSSPDERILPRQSTQQQGEPVQFSNLN